MNPSAHSDVSQASSASGSRLHHAAQKLGRVELTQRLGTVWALQGLAIESIGPPSQVGELCAVIPQGRAPYCGSFSSLLRTAFEGVTPSHVGSPGAAILAEVVAIRGSKVTLMPHGDMQGLSIGSTVVGLGNHSQVAVGPELLGRVIDGFGRPLDGRPAPTASRLAPLHGTRMNPMRRPRITKVLETGIRSIDALLTLGQGQRIGIFSGSGVGKSTLLGMIAHHVSADVNVIALIGERGREVRDFVDKQLGAEGLARSVVVVASADQPALARLRAAHAALSIAEHFRDEGQQVLLTMDSITRLAMARREVGLSAGEPPTARGYPPSVFAELPALCERCGTSPSGGSITALLTVLVEGDDFNEPVADALRAILDGHIVLSRDLAHKGQFPAIDVLQSASRLLPELSTADERSAIHETIGVLSLLERSRQMVELGAYERGSNPMLDAAISVQAELRGWLCQSEGGVHRAEALRLLDAWRQRVHAAIASTSVVPTPTASAGRRATGPGRSA